ncbi:MAG: toprim domain-containing protein [Bacteroidales bacterium]|nr:toprim domain-containing protein [Bacteroidales bacterium]
MRDDFTKTAQNNGYKNKYLEKSGLSIIKPHQAYDRFRNRVIFPIHNLTGKVTGFGARLLTNEKNKPKYLNSPESEIYNKSQILYGIYFAKSEMVREDKCLLVEGYTDVISLYQSGIKNVVASSGTSLTEDQIRLIRRYTQNITILYDGDAAGLKASFRGIDMILGQGMNVKIVLFPDGEDPDSYATGHSSTETKAYIEAQAQDFIRFKSKLLFRENSDDPTARANAIEE